MSIDRREFLAGIGGLTVSGLLGRAGGPGSGPDLSGGAGVPGGDFPRTEDFAIPDDVTFLNSAFTHPLPVETAEAIGEYAEEGARPGPVMTFSRERVQKVKSGFAELINATPAEISFVPNTSTGENLVVDGLGIPEKAGSGINVVTDALHFEGALVHLQALARDRGLDLRIVRPRDFRIELEDLEKAVDEDTELIELSLVAMYNGFQHDLEAVCDLAHAHDAYVYADVMQAAGAVPIDVRASGVDFCACSGFKWLMSDFGLGFLYAREELLGTAVERSHWGYHSVSNMETHFRPHDPPGEGVFSFEAGDTASDYFEAGSNANGALAALAASLPYLLELGVENIQAHRQPLLRRLQDEMPRLGFQPVTPPETTSPLVTFATENGREVAERLREERINARVASNYVRLSPSVFNDMDDVDRLLAALS